MHADYHRKKFDTNPFNFIAALLPCCVVCSDGAARVSREKRTSAMFCSEFVTQAYVDMGLLPIEVNP